ncbi:hypothetical protein CY35_06G119700 [Sphagnum magellanicum]|nr:hypothetical protein CY35_06G119700 [Sphagnum magellanicum]
MYTCLSSNMLAGEYTYKSDKFKLNLIEIPTWTTKQSKSKVMIMGIIRQNNDTRISLEAIYHLGLFVVCLNGHFPSIQL